MSPPPLLNMRSPNRLARKPRKKPRSSTQPAVKGPIPTPYLAVAPSPVSSLSQSRIDQLAGASTRPMILPSSFSRPRASPLASGTASPGPSRPSTAIGLVGTATAAPKRKGYAAGLLAPPTIMPGGTVAMPRIQGRNEASPADNRRRSTDRLNSSGAGQIVTISSQAVNTGGGAGTMATRRRSEERLRDIGQVNASMMSLGHLGQILETDPASIIEPVREEVETNPTGRRRRRVVRGEQGLARRPTVSSREEGRALGIARGASMRRTNVWDGEPPPFYSQ